MVLGKFRVSEIFVPISKSQRRFERVSKSRFLVVASRSLDLCSLANGFDQTHDKIVYFIKNVR